MVDENEFFREATLRLCRHLEIEQGLFAVLQYMSQFFPAEKIYLQIQQPSLETSRYIARADKDKGERIDLVTPVDGEARAQRQELEDGLAKGTFPTVHVVNRSDENPAVKRHLEHMNRPAMSIMVMPLVLADRHIGFIIVGSEGNDRYTDDDAKLLATLKEPFYVAVSNALKHDEVVELRDALEDDNRQLHRELLRITGDEIVGAEFGLRSTMEKVSKVAPTDTPVLLTGETGVGKDVIANAIHLSSPRSGGPFIPVNCGAIPDSLIDSELFGHEKGAFTGALALKRGRFERASKGTILLDEIGEMPMEAQVRLLRVLQQREIERVGGTEAIPVDIRIIAATNKSLPDMVEAGTFRQDLYFRLNVFPITVPALRERIDDIPALVHFFTERKARDLKVTPTPKVAPGEMDVLIAYHWPGNVRELENVVERAMIMHMGEDLRFDELAPSLQGKAVTATSPASGAPGADERSMNLDAATAAHITRALEIAEGKVFGPGGAAELLGVNPNTLRYRMRKLGIKSGRERG